MRRKKWKFEAVGIRRLKKRPRETKRVGTRACGHFFSNHVTEPSQWRAPDLLLFPFGPIWRLSRQKLQQQHRDKKGKKKNEGKMRKLWENIQTNWNGIYIFFSFWEEKRRGLNPPCGYDPSWRLSTEPRFGSLNQGHFCVTEHPTENPGASSSLLETSNGRQRLTASQRIPGNPHSSNFCRCQENPHVVSKCGNVGECGALRNLLI